MLMGLKELGNFLNPSPFSVIIVFDVITLTDLKKLAIKRAENMREIHPSPAKDHTTSLFSSHSTKR